MKTNYIIFSLFIFLFVTTNYAQDSKEIAHTIDSKVFGKKRTVKVFLPNRYSRDSLTKYPVTYVLDGQHDIFWNVVKGNIGYMVDNYSIMPMIVVGIVSDNRGKEFDPKSNKLQEHLSKEVFPLIAENYSIDNFKTIIGHSWGGAFVGNTLFSENRNMFDAYIGISPSFGGKDNIITKNATSLLKKQTNFGKFLYLSHGDVGRRELEFAGYVNTIDSLLQTYPNHSFAWQPRHIESVGHWQIVGPSLNDALLCMSRTYFADQKVIEDFSRKGKIKPQIAQFNKIQKERFGYIHKASVGYLNFVANDFRDQGKYDTAVEMYLLALDKKPDDVRVHLDLSNLYDKMNQKKRAKTTFLQTKKLLENQKADFSEGFYKNNMEWIEEKLASYDKS